MQVRSLIFVSGAILLAFALASCATTSPRAAEEEYLAEIDRLTGELEAAERTAQELGREVVSMRDSLSKAEQEGSATARELDLSREEIEALKATKLRLENRIRTLENLLQELSFAVSLGSRGESTQGLATSQDPGIEGVDPRVIAEVSAALIASLPTYETVETILPYQVPGRRARAFVPGSTVFAEDNQTGSQRFLYDSRANYSSTARIYAEVRTNPPGNGSGASQDLLVQGANTHLRLYFQVITDRSSPNLEIEAVEIMADSGRILLDKPQDKTRIQDSGRKLERLGFDLLGSDSRAALEHLTLSRNPVFVLLAKDQRLRVSLNQLEQAALVEMLKTYRDLGGQLP